MLILKFLPISSHELLISQKDKFHYVKIYFILYFVKTTFAHVIIISTIVKDLKLLDYWFNFFNCVLIKNEQVLHLFLRRLITTLTCLITLFNQIHFFFLLLFILDLLSSFVVWDELFKWKRLDVAFYCFHWWFTIHFYLIKFCLKYHFVETG